MEAERQRRAGQDSGKQDQRGLAQEERLHLAARRSEGHADADLRGAAGDAEAEQSVETQRGKRQGQRSETGGQARQ